MSNVTTYFASPERQPEIQVIQEHEILASIQNLTILLEAIPYIVLVLNQERQIVHSNSKLLETLGLTHIDSLLAKRPGEIIHCIHADEGPNGCGTSKHCGVCGAVQAILESQKTNKKASQEARITTVVNNKIVAWDLLIVSTPVELASKKYMIVSMADISAEKRKSHLEHIFFHDIMNTSAIIQGYSELLKDSVSQHEREIAEVIHNTTKHLVEEIRLQRELLSAESGNLIAHPSQVLSKEILETTLSQFVEMAAEKGCYLDIVDHYESKEFTTDKTLLIRSLCNLVKNAVEASKEGDSIHLRCWHEDEQIFFSVQNPIIIPYDVQLQIFNRSFSTKSPSRGWGTYSVKLLTEEYLQGKVSLLSEEGIGTIFTLELPLQLKVKDLPAT